MRRSHLLGEDRRCSSTSMLSLHTQGGDSPEVLATGNGTVISTTQNSQLLITFITVTHRKLSYSTFCKKQKTNKPRNNMDQTTTHRDITADLYMRKVRRENNSLWTLPLDKCFASWGQCPGGYKKLRGGWHCDTENKCQGHCKLGC